MIELADVEAAAERLAGRAHRTPVFTSTELNRRTGGELFLKAESLQRTGSFKFRGAANAIASLSDAEREAGVAAFSSGNHAQAVALAAKLEGVPATIVMPHDAPSIKVAATVGYGAEIVRYDRYTEDRAAVAATVAAERGATLIPPYDRLEVMAGQGTAALEVFAEVADVDHLLVCVGGGGLIAGCATVAAAQPQPVRVIGIEPEAGDDVRQSLEAGRRVEIDVPRTIADGQQVTGPGELTFPVIQGRVAAIELVSDAEIIDAMRFAFERLKLVLEPSGASALAAALAGRLDLTGTRTAITLSGGNIGLERFTNLINEV